MIIRASRDEYLFLTDKEAGRLVRRRMDLLRRRKNWRRKWRRTARKLRCKKKSNRFFCFELRKWKVGNKTFPSCAGGLLKLFSFNVTFFCFVFSFLHSKNIELLHISLHLCLGEIKECTLGWRQFGFGFRETYKKHIQTSPAPINPSPLHY